MVAPGEQYIVEFTLKIQATYVMPPNDLSLYYGQTAESLAKDLIEVPGDDEVRDLVTYQVIGYKQCQ